MMPSRHPDHFQPASVTPGYPDGSTSLGMVKCIYTRATPRQAVSFQVGYRCQRPAFSGAFGHVRPVMVIHRLRASILEACLRGRIAAGGVFRSPCSEQNSARPSLSWCSPGINMLIFSRTGIGSSKLAITFVLPAALLANDGTPDVFLHDGVASMSSNLPDYKLPLRLLDYAPPQR